MDILSPKERSARMALVRQKNTKPEMTLRSALHAAGYRFRVHRKDLPGKPDIVLPSRRKIIFVHGCFWHGHSCNAGRRPQSNTEFWEAKLSGNVLRDAAIEAELRELGWDIFTLWTCELKKEVLSKQLLQFLGPPRLVHLPYSFEAVRVSGTHR